MFVDMLRTLRLTNWFRLWFIVTGLCFLVSFLVPVVLFIITGLTFTAFLDVFFWFFKKIFRKKPQNLL